MKYIYIYICHGRWDFTFYRGSVVEHLDGHTDIIHVQLYSHWLPRYVFYVCWCQYHEIIVDFFLSLTPEHFRGMKPRDMLLRRYWRREDDSTYGIHISLKKREKKNYLLIWVWVMNLLHFLLVLLQLFCINLSFIGSVHHNLDMSEHVWKVMYAYTWK